MSEQLIYNVSEAAAIMRVSKAHVYRMVELRQLRAIRSGRRILIPRVSIERWTEYELEVQNEVLGWPSEDGDGTVRVLSTSAKTVGGSRK